MAHPSKNKGNNFERAIVNKAKEKGLESKRAWGSNGQSLGMHEEVDCVVEGYKIQAKCRKKLASFLIPSKEVDAVVCKQDYGETLIIMRYDDWLDEFKPNSKLQYWNKLSAEKEKKGGA